VALHSWQNYLFSGQARNGCRPADCAWIIWPYSTEDADAPAQIHNLLLMNPAASSFFFELGFQQSGCRLGRPRPQLLLERLDTLIDFGERSIDILFPGSGLGKLLASFAELDLEVCSSRSRHTAHGA
jgi:hypothetical protein